MLNFTKRLEKKTKYSNWFHPPEEIGSPTISTRNDKTIMQTKYTPVPFTTDHFHNSQIPFLTEVLNHIYSGKRTGTVKS